MKNANSYFTRVYRLDKIVKNWGTGTSDDFKKFLLDQFKRSRSEAEVRLSADRTVDNLKNDIAKNKESIRQSRLSLELAEGKARSKVGRAKGAIKREESVRRTTDGLKRQFQKRRRALLQMTSAGYVSKTDAAWRKMEVTAHDELGNQVKVKAGDVFDNLDAREKAARELLECFRA